MSVVPLHTPRWQPDDHLIEAAIGGRVHHDQLPEHDRAWLIAQLSHRGYHNAVISDWLRCSPRTVQNARAHPVYSLTLRLCQAESDLNRKSRPAPTVIGLTDLVRERDRLRDQRGQLIDQLAAARAAITECPPSVIILRPAHTPRRRRTAEPTMPLFEIGDTA